MRDLRALSTPALNLFRACKVIPSADYSSTELSYWQSVSIESPVQSMWNEDSEISKALKRAVPMPIYIIIHIYTYMNSLVPHDYSVK